MTLPPVVSDPERCPMRSMPHEPALLHGWELVADGDDQLHRVCRYCGGRKP